MSTEKKTAEEILKQTIPIDCIWDYADNPPQEWALVNTPCKYVLEAMEAYAAQKIEPLAEFLRWNISSIRNSPASREAMMQLDIYMRLLKKIDSLT